MALPTTQWTLLARLSEPAHRDDALAVLCSTYRQPVYAFLRGSRFSHEDSEDLTQGFFELVMRQGLFEQADRASGRLRSFLLSALQNFLANSDRSRRAQKRGGGMIPVSLDDDHAQEEVAGLAGDHCTPSEAFDRAWLQMVLQRVMGDLRQQYSDAGRGALFEAMLPWLLEGSLATQSEAARQLDLSLSNFRVQVHRLRRRFRDALQQEVAQTVSDDGDLAEEIDYFFRITRRGL